MSSCCNLCAVKDKMRDNVKKVSKPKTWKKKSPDLELARVAFQNKKVG
jgi:hypothetical protein